MIALVEIIEPQENNLSFPCTSCGLCCKNLGLSSEASKLNRGDGTCLHFDDNTNLCLIYEDRPLVCRVEDYYAKYLSETFEWNDFVALNLEVCETLQKNRSS